MFEFFYDILQQPPHSKIPANLFWVSNISDIVIGFCYIAVAAVFARSIYRKRKNIPYYGIFIVLATYVFICGTGYFAQIVNRYYPISYFLATWNLLMALVSILTAFTFIFLLPKIITIKEKEENRLREKTKKLIKKQKIIESALIESESKTAAVFDKTFIYIFLLHPSGTIWEVNQAGLNFINLTPKDAQGKNFVDVLGWILPEDKAGIMDSINSAAKGSPCRKEVDILWSGEQKITMSLSLQPFQTQKCNFYSILIEATDISEHKQIQDELVSHKEHLLNIVDEKTLLLKKTIDELKEKQSLLKALLNCIPDPLYYKDIDGNYLGYNTAFAEYINKSSNNVLLAINNKRLTPSTNILIAQVNKFASSKDDEKQAMQSGIVRKEEFYQAEDGNTVYFETLKTPYYNSDHKLLGVISISRDITERKEQQKVLEEAIGVAREASVTKGLFLANMSHEIRTPINGIIGCIELLLRSELDIQQYDYISKMKTASYSLLGIVNDVLDFSKIEEKELTLTKTSFNLNDILEDIADIFTNTAFDKGINLVVDSRFDFSMSLVGEPVWLRQVLINLVGNAIKFTNKGEVSLVITPNDTINGFNFTIKDTGIGISAEDQEKLFLPFTQVDESSKKKYGGTGLGLSVSSGLVKLMGGDLLVDSTPGKGSTFYFSIPLEKQVSFGAPTRKDKMKSKKALVVNNDVKYLPAINKMLVYFGFDTTLVSEFATLPEFSSFNYDIIIYNGNIEKYYDIEIVKQIKNSKLAFVPVIFLGYFAEQKKIETLYDLDVSTFLVKPVKIATLFDAIIEIFGGSTVKRYGTKRIWVGQTTMSLRDAHILLVEDNKLNQQIAKELLETAEIKVSIANNGKEAISILKQNDFDLILMDIQMPEMDGYEATQKIRQGKNKVPIIAMTAYAMAGDKEKCLMAGMNDHLTKPIEPEILFTTLIRWLKIRENKNSTEISLSEKLPPETIDVALDIPYIDVKNGIHRTGSNKQFFAKILLKYCKEYESVENKISKIIVLGNYDHLKKIVHEIKGVSANIGASVVEKSAKELEKKIGVEKDIKPFTDKFCDDIKQTIAAIKNSWVNNDILKAEQNVKEAEQNMEESTESLVQNLDMYLQKFIPAESLKIILQLKKWNPSRSNELEKLEKLVKKYQFREAKKLLDYQWKN